MSLVSLRKELKKSMSGKKILYPFSFLLVVFLFSQHLTWADSSNQIGRWRLEFKNDVPKEIILTEPDGTKRVYWYFRYTVRNNTDRDISYMVKIKMVIDKTKPGIPTSQVPQIFANAKIPSTVADKKEYIESLQTYHDIDLPIVKNKIMESLRLYPKLSEKERAVWSVVSNTEAASVFQVMETTSLSYVEAESTLNRLTVKNLMISQEVDGNPTFVGSKKNEAFFWLNDDEVVRKAGEEIAGWEVVSFDKNSVVLKKNGIQNYLRVGSGLEYLYTKTDKALFERDDSYLAGFATLGNYKGRNAEGDGPKYEFKRNMIKKNSSLQGIAIFSNPSPETDFMAIVVSGLIDPIVQRYNIVYAYNEVAMFGYRRVGGDEFSTQSESLVPLYRKWEVLATKVIRRHE